VTKNTKIKQVKNKTGGIKKEGEMKKTLDVRMGPKLDHTQQKCDQRVETLFIRHLLHTLSTDRERRKSQRQ